jgi:Ni,Fe-hydrogenase maturation factor
MIVSSISIGFKGLSLVKTNILSTFVYYYFNMETVLIQIHDAKAYKLLEDLEDLHILKVLKKNIQPQQKLSEKYAGKLSSEVAEDLQNYVTQSRNEWDNPTI